MRVDDERRAVCNAIYFIANAKTINEGAVCVAKAPLVQCVQVFVFAAPCQLAEFIVCGTAKNNAITVCEFIVQLCELNDFRRADECEIFWIEEEDLPFTFEGILRDCFECALAVLFMGVEFRLYASHGKIRKFVANAEHTEVLSDGFKFLWPDHTLAAVQNASEKFRLLLSFFPIENYYHK